MNIFQVYKKSLAATLDQMIDEGALVGAYDLSRVTVELPRDPSHGDMATNVAMVTSKQFNKNPRELAQMIASTLVANDHTIASAEIAGPGFINLKLKTNQWGEVVRDILHQGIAYGDSKMGQGEKALVEYVSANPTGPMHAGHTRGAVIGDCLANLLLKAGFDVTREYYFNDAGTQVDVLAKTVHLRYREALGEDIGTIPEGFYPGEYLKDVAQDLVKRDGDLWLTKPETEWLSPVRSFAVQYMMNMIKYDLEMIGIHHDIFTNERDLIENGTLETSFKILEDKGLIYTGTLPPPRGKEMDDWEPVPLTLFKSTAFGDASDRPLKKRDGTWAYIMPDIAYHYDKVRRGYTNLINLLGMDHGGYLEKMRPVVHAFSDGKTRLDVIYNGMVKVLKNGVPVKFSKRSGNIITLREMIEEVGADVVRFFMIVRAPDTEFEFDYAKVVEQSKDNPVFYVQYAHARCCSVFRNAHEILKNKNVKKDALAQADLNRLSSDGEIALIRSLAFWPRLVEIAAENREPHRVAYYLHDVASAFHSFWHAGRDDAALRFIHEDNEALTLARLALVEAVRLVLASGLNVLGVKPLEEMHA